MAKVLLCFLLLADVVAKIVQPLQLLFPKMDLIQCVSPLLVQHPQALGLGALLFQQEFHVGFNLIVLKSHIVQGHDHTQAFQIRIVILPGAHDRFHRAAQAPALVLP